MTKIVAMAMSGGIDSSVGAYLLKTQGYTVIGATLALWRGSLCCSFQEAGEARVIARKLDIPHYLIDGIEAFRQTIVNTYTSARLRGETPNPCVDCNPLFKVDYLWKALRQRSALDCLATGHYVQKKYNPHTKRYELWQAEDKNKDQSYMLWRLSQSQLARLEFPLGGLSKAQIREQALALGWQDLAQKPESQDLCFMTPDALSFWQEQAPEGCLPGPIQDISGKLLGKHQGCVFYTLGQRKGLNIPAKERLYVTQIQASTNTLVVGQRPLTQDLPLHDINWVSIAPWHGSDRLYVKTHYRSPLQAACLEQTGENQGICHLAEPVAQMAPGQSCVFYSAQGQLLGGGEGCVLGLAKFIY